MYQLVLVLSSIGLPCCEWELGGLIVAVIVQSAGRVLVLSARGTTRIRLGNGPDRAEFHIPGGVDFLPRVNFPGSLDDVGI